jgi:hypothetical protein
VAFKRDDFGGRGGELVEPDELVQRNEAYAGFSPSSYGAPAVYVAPVAPAPPVAAPQFRPLSTGEVLDRTFALYKKHFWLFAGLGMLPAGVLLVASAIRLILLATTHHTYLLQPSLGIQPGSPAPAGLVGSMVMMQVYFLPAVVLFLIAYGVSNAAAVDAVNRIGQGLVTSVATSYNEVRGRWLRWCGIVLRQFWSAAWPMVPGMVLLFGSIALIALPKVRGNVALLAIVGVLGWGLVVAGIVLGVINFIRHSLAGAAGVSENIGVNASMRRSRMLAAGHKGRLFLAWLLVYALQMVVAAVQLPLVFAAMSLRGGAFIGVQAVVMLIQFVAVTLVTPVASIAFTLFYIDERVRREGFDIELLMRHTLPQTVPAYIPEI